MSENNLEQSDLLSQGYGIIPKKVMRDQTLSAESKAIYAYLSSFCGNGNTAFPSISLMCHDLGMGEDRFLKHRKPLIEHGYIQINKKKSSKGYMSNIYTLPQTIYPDFKGTENKGTENRGTNNNSSINNSINKDNMSSSEKIPYSEIISFLNQVTNKKYKVTQKWKDLIKARWNEGQRVDDFKKVISVKSSQWLNDSNMNKYLRPQTLFGNKFDDYLQEYREPAKPKQTKDDFEELEDLFGDPA